MKDKLSAEQISAILKALDDAIEQGPWEESNFLKVIGKNLREIRDTYKNQLSSPQDKAKLATAANQMALRNGQQEIFIALYSTDGNNLQSWERILVNLPKQMISRPIYADEKDIKAIIKTKENKINEAYVSVYVNQGDILPVDADKSPVDKLGKSLLSLRDKSFSLESINHFIHQSGVYSFAQGRLIKTTNGKTE